MENISKMSQHAETKTSFEVEVLLALYNGEKYLPEFLESLANQNRVKVHLYVSDDGSSDKSIEIVKRFEHKFVSVKFTNGPKTGPADNFFHLLSLSTHDYVALADQDDIWLPNHLINSIERLLPVQQLPSLSYALLEEFNTKGTIGIFPVIPHPSSVRQILTENPARGCTFVLNGKAVHLINKYKPLNAIMHDWWILLLIFSSGNVVRSQEPEIKYRIHENNTIGMKPGLFNRLSRYVHTFRKRAWAPYSQAEELFTEYEWSMRHVEIGDTADFLTKLRSSLLGGRAKLVLQKGRLRSSLVDDMGVRLIFLARRQRKENEN
jgi:rhamnosyltransferase